MPTYTYFCPFIAFDVESQRATLCDCIMCTFQETWRIQMAALVGNLFVEALYSGNVARGQFQ